MNIRQLSLICISFFLLSSAWAQNNVGIGTVSPHPSARLEISSIDQGVLVPRMTKSQRDAIPGPATGLLVYQTDAEPCFYYFDGTAWLSLCVGTLADSAMTNAGLLPFAVPTYLEYTGNCGDGNYLSSGRDTIGTGQEFCNFTLRAGDTLCIPGSGTFGTGKALDYMILVKDTCRIEGVILGKGNDESCKTASASTLNCSVVTYDNSLSAGGGGRGYSQSGCGVCGCTDRAQLLYNPYGNPITFLHGTPGKTSSSGNCATVGNPGPDGGSILQSELIDAIQIRPYLGGLSGKTASGGCGVYSSGCGGAGLTIVCDVLIFSGEIDLSGGQGKNACNSCTHAGGAGGGGAGSAVISANTIIVNTGSTLHAGGSPGSGRGASGTAGGTGGDGAFLIIDR